MVRIGLAGLGRFGKSHATVFADLLGAGVVAVCDSDPAEVRSVGDRLGIGASGRFTDSTTMIDAGLDAVVIVTPEPLYAELSFAAIERGLYLFCEKPLATTSAEGHRVAAAAQAADVELQVGFLLRFGINHAHIKDEIVLGACCGPVSLRLKRNVSRAWFPDYGDDAHPAFETTIYDIDLNLWYVDRPCIEVYTVSRSLTGPRYPDACFALLRFEGGAIIYLKTAWIPEGAPATVLTGTWQGTFDPEVEVVGTVRAARPNALDSGLSIWTPDRVTRPDSSLWPALHGRMAGALREEDAQVILRVSARVVGSDPGMDRVPSVSAAVTGLQIAEAIVESAERAAPAKAVDSMWQRGE